MTNYNERLDEIFGTFNNKVREKQLRKGTAHCPDIATSWCDDCIEEYYVVTADRVADQLYYERAEAKQAITSLIKELVAEAKPEIKAHPLGPVTLADCQRGLDQFEQNLLKELEEV